MKKHFAIMVITVLVLSLTSCSQGPAVSSTTAIENYIKENSNYSLQGLEVTTTTTPSEVRIVARMKENSNLEDFPLFSKEIVTLSMEAVDKVGFTIEYVNTIVNPPVVSHVGWDTNGRLYDRYGTISENISVDMLESELAKFKVRFEHPDIFEYIEEHIETNSSYNISYISRFGDINALLLTISIEIQSEDEPIMDDVGNYVEQVTVLTMEAVQAIGANISILSVGLVDTNDRPIINWISEDGVTGLLSDNRGGSKATYSDVRYTDVETILSSDDE